MRNFHIGRLFISWLWWDQDIGAGGPNRVVWFWFHIGPLMIAWDKKGAP